MEFCLCKRSWCCCTCCCMWSSLMKLTLGLYKGFGSLMPGESVSLPNAMVERPRGFKIKKKNLFFLLFRLFPNFFCFFLYSQQSHWIYKNFLFFFFFNFKNIKIIKVNKVWWSVNDQAVNLEFEIFLFIFILISEIDISILKQWNKKNSNFLQIYSTLNIGERKPLPNLSAGLKCCKKKRCHKIHNIGFATPSSFYFNVQLCKTNK